MSISQHPVRQKQGQDRGRTQTLSALTSAGSARPPAVQQLPGGEALAQPVRAALQHSHARRHGLSTVCFLGTKAFPSSAVFSTSLEAFLSLQGYKRKPRTYRHEF